MSYTKGKWKNQKAWLDPKDTMFYQADVICGGVRVAKVAGIGEDFANANAKLISSAPDLLEACKEALFHLTKAEGEIAGELKRNPYSYECVKLLKKAIAKAEEK